MPLAASCSAIISANCHRPEMDINSHLLPVLWGVTGDEMHGEQVCSFTTYRDVTRPVMGEHYAGASRIITSKKMKKK